MVRYFAQIDSPCWPTEHKAKQFLQGNINLEEIKGF